MAGSNPIPTVATPGFSIVVQCGPTPYTLKLRTDGASEITPDLPNRVVFVPLNVSLLTAFKATLAAVRDAKGGGKGGG